MPGAILPVTVQIAFLNGPLDANADCIWTDITSAYFSAVMSDLPAAYWRLGERSGTTAVDEASGNHDLLYVNAPTLGVTGALTVDPNTAVTFSRASFTYMYGADSTSLRGFSAITIEAWVRAIDFTANGAIVCKGLAGINDYSLFLNTAGRVNLTVRTTAGAVTNTFATVLSTGIFYHIVATYDGVTFRLYVNGALSSSTANTKTFQMDTTYALMVGWDQAAIDSYFNGTLDEVAIYGSALSATRVAAHYAAASGAGLSSASLIESGSYRGGREMALGPLGAGALEVKLDDPLRWLEPGYASSPYYPNAKRGRRCRLRSGSTTLWTGVIERLRATSDNGLEQKALLTAAGFRKALNKTAYIDYAVARDNFDRANATGLGTPDLGAAWSLTNPAADYRILNNTGQVRFAPYIAADFRSVYPIAGTAPSHAGGVWAVPTGGFAGAAGVGAVCNAVGESIAVSDAGFADGVITAYYPTLDTPADSWLVFRYSDASNFWYLRRRVIAAGPTYDYRLFKRVAGADFQQGAPYASAIPDVRIFLSGSLINIAGTGSTSLLAIGDAFNATATKHGIGGTFDATWTAQQRVGNFSFYPAAVATLTATALADDGVVGAYIPISVPSVTVAQGTPALIFRFAGNNFLFMQVTGDNPFTIVIGKMENGIATTVQTYTVDASNAANYGNAYGGNYFSVALNGTAIVPTVHYWKAVSGQPALTSWTGTATASALNTTSDTHGIGCPMGTAATANPFAARDYYAFDDFAIWGGRPAELPGVRIGALLDLMGWPAADRFIATGNYYVSALPAPLKPVSDTYSLIDLIELTAASDGGIFYFDAAGNAVFEGGNTRSTQARSTTSQATFGSAGGTAIPVAAWPSRSSEDTDTINDALVTGASGTPQRVSDQAAIAADGRYTRTTTTLNASDADALALARAQVSRYAPDYPEVRQFEIDGVNTLAQAQILARAISDRVTVTYAPPEGGGAFTAPLFIEGFRHQFDQRSWRSMYQTSAAQQSSYWILEDAYLGVLESTTIPAPG